MRDSEIRRILRYCKKEDISAYRVRVQTAVLETIARLLKVDIPTAIENEAAVFVNSSFVFGDILQQNEFNECE